MEPEVQIEMPLESELAVPTPSHLSPDHKSKAIQALEGQLSEKSPANFHDTPSFSPLSEVKKAM